MELQWGKVSNSTLEIKITQYYNIIILITFESPSPPPSISPRDHKLTCCM